MPGVRVADGSLDFSGGVDSARVTTVQSASNPNGLPRTMLAWLNNATVRNGGVSPRNGWNPLGISFNPALYQGGITYGPDFGSPYLIVSIGGQIYSALVDPPYTIVNLSQEFGLSNPPGIPQCFMCQAEQFLIIQAGDYLTSPKPTLPLFWDGFKLTRSRGILGVNNTPLGGATPYNEIPAATCMCYYQGRVWYAQQRTVSAGDIVDDQASGTAAYDFRDSVLKVTENPLAIGGDGFTVPSTAGDIRALDYSANLDSTLGEGPLYIFTRKQVYSLVVPVTRADWIAATNNNQPQMIVVQRHWGSVSDRCVVAVNGDLFYQSLEPAIRSLFVSLRYFSQWGNVPISRNETRALQFNNRAIMQTACGVQFDNRLLMALLPMQTPVGVAFQGIAPLDFDIISQFGAETLTQTKVPPAWEGIWEGLPHLQLFADDFGGLERCFTIIYSQVTGKIEVWEITDYLQFQNGDNRISWVIETPAYTFGKEFDLKKLDGGEIWLDSIYGKVDIKVEYRVDADACWRFWHEQEVCVTRNSCEDVANPVCYPIQQYCEGFKFPLTLPDPPADDCGILNHRPTNVGYQFQMRLTITGWMRVRGLLLYAIPVERKMYEGLNC